MANVYTFTQSDIDALVAQNVTMLLNGNPVAASSVLTDTGTLVATAGSGRKFYMNPATGWSDAYSSIYFNGWDPVAAENKDITFILSNGDTVATFNPVAGMSMYNFFVTTEAAAVPLAWVDHPSSGQAGADVAFSWVGGEPGPSGYNLVVTSSDELTTFVDVQIPAGSPNYTLNMVAGSYVVNVYDKGGSGDGSATRIVQTITLAEVLPKALYTVQQADIDAIVTNDIDMRVNGAPVALGTVLRLGDSVVANVTGNRKFYVDSSLNRVSINFQVFFDAEMMWLEFTLSNGDQTATFTMVDDTSGSEGTYQSWNISTAIETPQVVGTNNVYRVTPEILAEVNKQRFVTVVGGSTVYDYGQFILSVLQFPFDIPADVVAGTEPIQLADKQLTVSGEKLLTDQIRINLGEIIIPDNYGNMLSYANTTAIIHLPLAPSVELDLEYVIGQTIGVYYLLDCYSGVATVNLTSTKLEAVFSSTQVDIGVSVPYMANAYTAPENTDVAAGGDNGVKTPYVEIIRNDAVLADGFFTTPVIVESPIGEQVGYIKVEDVDLNTTALGDEKEMILSILANGVILK